MGALKKNILDIVSDTRRDQKRNRSEVPSPFSLDILDLSMTVEI